MRFLIAILAIGAILATGCKPAEVVETQPQATTKPELKGEKPNKLMAPNDGINN